MSGAADPTPRGRDPVDVLVIGSGGAGLRAAIAAADAGASVVLATKGQFGRCGATLTATADVAVDGASIASRLGLPGDPEDSMDLFVQDVLDGGKHINREPLVRALVEEAPDRVRELVDWGLKLTGILGAPGHRYPRGVTAHGRTISRLLEKETRHRPVELLDDVLVTHVLTHDGRANGVLAMDLHTGTLFTLPAAAIVIASGGAMGIFPRRTAPVELTGDGYALALRAGARLVDMEMVQWLACTFMDPPIWRGLQLPWLLGPQGNVNAWLLNRYGDRFMARWDPVRMERATRDTVAIAIMKEILEGRGSTRGGVYLSWSHLPAGLVDDLVRSNGTHIDADWMYQGFDFAEFGRQLRRGEAAEVAPACHYFMGGIEIDLDCATIVPGLYAAGEVTGGAHGANRLSGCAMTELLVHGARAGRAAAGFARADHAPPPAPAQVAAFANEIAAPLERGSGPRPTDLRDQLLALAWETIGLVRGGAALRRSLQRVRTLADDVAAAACIHTGRRYNLEWVTALVNRNVALTIEAVAASALAREESRGAHYREDFPDLDDLWQARNVIVSLEPGGTGGMTAHAETRRPAAAVGATAHG